MDITLYNGVSGWGTRGYGIIIENILAKKFMTR
jgi:hypothetical protein